MSKTPPWESVTLSQNVLRAPGSGRVLQLTVQACESSGSLCKNFSSRLTPRWWLGVFYTMEICKCYQFPQRVVVKFLLAHRCLEGTKVLISTPSPTRPRDLSRPNVVKTWSRAEVGREVGDTEIESEHMMNMLRRVTPASGCAWSDLGNFKKIKSSRASEAPSAFDHWSRQTSPSCMWQNHCDSNYAITSYMITDYII